MVKDRIPKRSLEHMALIEIRAYSGCEDVSKVDVEFAPEREAGTNWHIVSVDCPFEKLECAARAAIAVHNKLRERYSLLG